MWDDNVDLIVVEAPSTPKPRDHSLPRREIIACLRSGSYFLGLQFGLLTPGGSELPQVVHVHILLGPKVGIIHILGATGT